MKEVRVLSIWAWARRTNWHAAFRVLLLGALLLLVGARSADAGVKGQVSLAAENGFIRILFTFAEDVEPEVRLANNIILIIFKQPVDVMVDKLSIASGGVISVARRDPDGRGIRIALGRRAKMNHMAVGDKLFVDLMPDTWTGLPPGLPREVIEELARRAREADRRLRQQRVLARQAKTPSIRVRVAHQPTFTRYVFDLPELIGVAANTGKDKLTLTFDAAFKFDLADAKATLPATVSAIDTAVEQEAAVVSFSFSAKVDVRTFREDLSFIVDVTPMDGKRQEGANDLSVMAAELAARTKARPTGVEPPQTMPARAPAASEERPRETPPAEKPSRNAEAPPSPVAPSSPAPPPSAPVPNPEMKAAPKPDTRSDAAIDTAPAPDLASSQAPSTSKESPKESAKEVSKEASKDTTKETSRPGVTPPPAATAPVAVERAPAPAHQAPRQSNGAITVGFKRQGDNLTLQFPFLNATPAAIFARGDTLWLVFDTDATIVLGKESEGKGTIRSTSVVKRDDLALVRIKLERPRLVSAVTDGPAWTVAIGEVSEPTRPTAISRNIVGAARASITVAFEEAQRLHRLSDPEAGDTLLVVTALGPARGFVKAQDFVEFRALASTHGIVLQPIADDLGAELAVDKIVVSRPPGLTLSPPADKEERSGSTVYQPHVLSAQAWGVDRQADFRERNMQLIRAAAEASDAKRNLARADLARFYLARDMSVEAKAVLDVALAESPPTAEDPTTLVLHAVANIGIGRLDAALKDLNHPYIGNQYDAPLWRALIYARQGKWSDAREGFRTVGMTLGTLPLDVQRIMLKDSVRASLESGDVTGAVSQMHEFEAIGVPRELEATLSVLSGRIAEGLGRIDDALRAYQAAADSWDRPAASQARLRELVLKRTIGQIKRADAIAQLETLTTVWRGDETEVEALALLARLYTEEGRYRDGFQIMRTALAAHPDSTMTQRIHDDAATTFDGLFLAGKGDALSPIDALGLFYDFRDLTPIGRRGDEMIRRLADRLVAVDLLDQAAELLQHQVDHRLQGAARAQVATRLAIVYLMNRKADRALATLRATRSADLTNDLRNQRLLLEARALSELGRHAVAAEVIAGLTGRETMRLRADIMWAGKQWRPAAEQIEEILGDRWSEFEPLTDGERQDVLRAAIGYVLGDDPLGAGRLRERFAGKMGDGPDRRAFDVVTAPVGPIPQTADGREGEFREIARALASVDTLSAFLRDLRARYPDSSASAPPSQKADPASTGTIPRAPGDPAASPLPPNPTTAPRPAKGRTAAG